MTTWFVYAPRRLECARCGIHVEYLPWALGKRPVTQSFAWFLASWAKLLSWQVISRRFQTSWESVFRSVEMAVDWGRERIDLTGISALGVDEIYWKKGKFLTLVYQINHGMKRLLFVVENRQEKSLRQFFVWFGKERSALIEFICSDMWKPYLNVIAKHAPNALNILDRYHIAAKMNKALDEVRAKETRALKLRAQGAKVILTHSRWCLLKRELRSSKRSSSGSALVPANHTRIPAQGRVPAVLGVCLPGVGGEIYGPMVQKGDAIAPRANEENRRHDPHAQAAYLELVSGAR
jgi:transposase